MEMQLRQAVMTSEQKVQQVYAQEMEALITKMKAISEELGKSKSLDLVLEATESGFVHVAHYSVWHAPFPVERGV